MPLNTLKIQSNQKKYDISSNDDDLLQIYHFLVKTFVITKTFYDVCEAFKYQFIIFMTKKQKKTKNLFGTKYQFSVS